MSRSKFGLLNAGVLREWFRRITLVRLLSRVPLGWVVLLGILGLPVLILSIVVAFVVAFLVIIFLVVLMMFGLLFYLLVLRPMLGSRKRPEKVIEVEYTVKPGPEDS